MKIGIIGGGAAGMFAACHAARPGTAVTLLERNKGCGVKLKLTGKGRCNLTNNCDLETLLANIPQGGRFLYSAFSGCMPQDVMAFFEEWGVPVKTERGNRVFPQSDRAGDLVDALHRCMKERGVKVVQTRVQEITTRNGSVSGVETDRGHLVFDKVILATGGLSYPRTGSSGDGLEMARRLGHRITDTRASLVPQLVKGEYPKRLEGLSLRNVTLTVKKKGKTQFSDFGEMLFTSTGVSGPLVLSASAHLRGEYPYQMEIDLKPALDRETLDKRLLHDFEKNLNRDFANSLSALLPAKLIPVMVELSGIRPDQKVNGITRPQRERLCTLLKALPFEITGPGSYHEAVITSGGVELREINPKTMESKLVTGLFFAGEIIDADGYTGGFNLQIAWSTAWQAAEHL